LEGKNLVINTDSLEPEQLNDLMNLVREWAKENETTATPIETGELGLEIIEVLPIGRPNDTFNYVTKGDYETSRDENKANKAFFNDCKRSPDIGEHHFPIVDGVKKSVFTRIVMRADYLKDWVEEQSKEEKK